MIASRLSIAKSRPISGLLPAPKPSRPNLILFSIGLLSSDCWSVLQIINSTPWIPCSYICRTALPPAPPTPATIIIDSEPLSAFRVSIISSFISQFLYFFDLLRSMACISWRVNFRFNSPSIIPLRLHQNDRSHPKLSYLPWLITTQRNSSFGSLIWAPR